MQPPGYAEGVHYFSPNRYREGLFKLQSQVLEGASPTLMPENHWAIAPNMITSLADIADRIYVVLPKSAKPIFKSTSADPAATTSSRKLEYALTRYYGYSRVSGGKGSHVKLKKDGAQTLHLPGDRASVSPGVVKQVLNIFGGASLSSLPDFLAGNLAPTT